jgi:ATP-binding cassette subfamily B protein
MKEQDRAQAQKPLRWLWNASAGIRWEVLLLLIAQMLSGVSGVALAWATRDMIDGAVDRDFKRFLLYAALFVGVLILQLLLHAFVRWFREHASSTLENRLKQRLFSVLLDRDYAAVTAQHSEEWMNRLVSDTSIAANGVVSIVPEASGMFVMLVSAVGATLWMLRTVTWIVVPVGVGIVVAGYLFRKKLKKLHKDIREADGRLRVTLSERLFEMILVRTFQREKDAERQANAAMEEHRAARLRRSRYSCFANFMYGLLMRSAYAAAAIFCAVGIFNGTLTYGTFSAVLQLVGQIQTPFASLAGYLPQYYAMLASAERLMEAEAYRKDCEAPKKDAAEIAAFYRNDFTGIGIEDVTFTYRPDAEIAYTMVFEHLSAEIRKGETVVLTGASGSGKSTLLKLLLCLYPVGKGRRLLLTDRGEELLTAAYRGLFAYVPQGNRIFSGTVRETLTFGDQNVTDDAIWQALSIAAADFVQELPDGLGARLGERGAGLSEGQLQRLAIARAVLSEHPILLLDEATSALDEGTEERLLNNLKRMTDRTVLIVTHRPRVRAISDRVWVLHEDGTATEERHETT